ncbi:MAG: hypothetical protein A2516_05570 [Alphaproteobacteria bacterium RIFOXYD12_FULL_60_8]|nr:MAG: hypothetical protein A2516_05570 [Alphaproteobacteria bacterium RIFOXYD12_FULL_60_8]
MAGVTTQCKTLTEVRECIDLLDAQIVTLLAERAKYVHEAARFKESRQGVIVPSRIEEIIARVRQLSIERGANPDLMERIYRSMIDAYIVSEQDVWDNLNG